MDDNTEKIFKLLKVNSTEDTINKQQKLWNSSIEDLSKVEDILRCNSEDIPATEKDAIATIILSLEKHADEVKSYCEKILQSLPEHRGERGRTHKYQGHHDTGYILKPTTSKSPLNILLKNAYGCYDVRSKSKLVINMVCMFMKCLSDDIIHVWFGYKEGQLPIFVAIVKRTNRNLDEIFEKHAPVPVTQRLPDEFSEEAEICLKKEVGLRFSFAEYSKLHDAIAQCSGQLMKFHSNLLAVSASKIKSREMGVRTDIETCIVLYVHVKGVIPVEEEPFPSKVGEFLVDVREGVFSKYMNPKLAMGSCVLSKSFLFGKLGGFVRLLNSRLGCLTCWHLFDYPGFERDFTEGSAYVYQVGCFPMQAFGKVVDRASMTGDHENIGLDAALIEITDRLSAPDDGCFQILPSVEPVELIKGFSGEILTSPMEISDLYATRDARCKIVRYNEASRKMYVRTGKLQVSGMSCNLDSWYPSDSSEKCQLFNQIEIHPDLNEEIENIDKTFASEGDSGALVFLVSKNGDRAWAIGMVVGGITKVGSAIVTPLWAILGHFNLPMKLLTFQNRKLEKVETEIKQLSERVRQQHLQTLHEIGQLKEGIQEIKNCLQEAIRP